MSKRILFLCSGGGGNMKAVHRLIEAKALDATLVAVLADRPCGALTYAAQQGIAHEKLPMRDDWSEPAARIASFAPDIIVTNVHRIVPPALVQKYAGRIINLHYSLLPAFGGSIGDGPVRAALDYGAKLVGATVHHVTEQVDAGPPIVQAALPVLATDTSTSLLDLQFKTGVIALYTFLTGATTPGTITLEGRACLINPAPSSLAWATPTFWSALA